MRNRTDWLVKIVCTVFLLLSWQGLLLATEAKQPTNACEQLQWLKKDCYLGKGAKLKWLPETQQLKIQMQMHVVEKDLLRLPKEVSLIDFQVNGKAGFISSEGLKLEKGISLIELIVKPVENKKTFDLSEFGIEDVGDTEGVRLVGKQFVLEDGKQSLKQTEQSKVLPRENLFINSEKKNTLLPTNISRKLTINENGVFIQTYIQNPLGSNTESRFKLLENEQIITGNNNLLINTEDNEVIAKFSEEAVIVIDSKITPLPLSLGLNDQERSDVVFYLKRNEKVAVSPMSQSERINKDVKVLNFKIGDFRTDNRLLLQKVQIDGSVDGAQIKWVIDLTIKSAVSDLLEFTLAGEDLDLEKISGVNWTYKKVENGLDFKGNVPADLSNLQITVKQKKGFMIKAPTVVSNYTQHPSITNFNMNIKSGWVLWSGGAKQGPIVKIWGLLGACFGFLFLLEKILDKKWFLGFNKKELCAFIFPMLLVSFEHTIVICLLCFGWLYVKDRLKEKGNSSKNLNIMLIIWAVFALLNLIIMIKQGLLGSPNMFIENYMGSSTLTWVSWKDESPYALLISYWCWSLLMLGWALFVSKRFVLSVIKNNG